VNDLEVLKETDFNFLGPKRAGKVRDIYDRGDKLILITTDRHSSFDRIIAHVPWKGQVLNQVSDWWFDKTKDIIVNHVLATPDPNVTQCPLWVQSRHLQRKTASPLYPQ
jgi:phosphoribosylaminoimidazole-succinocarboxamide synthase